MTVGGRLVLVGQGSEVFGIGYCNRDVAVAFCRKAVAIGGSLVSVLAGSGCWGSLSMERFQFSSLKSSFLSSENWQRQAPFDVQVLWVLPIGASLRLQKQDMCWIILKESLSIYGKLATVELEKLRILEKLKYLEVKPELLRHRHMLALPQPQAKARHNKAISRDTWSQLLEFARMVDPTLSNYDAEGAWPYLIDEFVEYLNENGIIRKGQLNDWSQKY
ncbi:hypothetical protein C3L33_23435, partial [Rhododendron williamsianum]